MGNKHSKQNKSAVISVKHQQNRKKTVFIKTGDIVKNNLREWRKKEKQKQISISSLIVKPIELKQQNDDNIYIQLYPINNHKISQKNAILYVIGLNYFGGFGLGETEETIKELTRCDWSVDKHIIDILSGNEYSIYRTATNEYYCGGLNNNGECGLNHNKSPIKTTEKIEYFATNDYVAPNPSVGIASHHMFWMSDDGKLYGNGDNKSGQLGTDDPTKQIFPPKELKYFADNGLNVVSTASAYYYSLVLCHNGYVYSSGKSKEGGLGHGDNTKSLTKWKRIESLTNHTIIQVVAGWDFSVFLDDTGNVWTSGRNKGLLN